MCHLKHESISDQTASGNTYYWMGYGEMGAPINLEQGESLLHFWRTIHRYLS